MAIKKSSSQRSSGKKGEDRKAGPKKYFLEKPIRSKGQRSQVKKKISKKTW